ncbi:MAG: tyrosine-type recombinase/integrase, partial [Xanthobacteraceae bacterium]
RLHLSPTLAGKLVATLNVRDFRPWTLALRKAELTSAAINRINSVFKACLNHAAMHDERIVTRAWERALANIPDAVESRNIILDETTIRAIVSAAYQIGTEFGLLVEVAAITGARVSQLARLEVQDLQAARSDPRLLMPSSRKGRGQKKISRRPVPIPPSLAVRLLANAQGRAAAAALLVKPSGDLWRKSDHSRLFARAVTLADLDKAEPAITFYTLRHSNIARLLLAGTPIRVVAAAHDTSVVMIERTYSRHITDASDTSLRRAMLDMSEPVAGNVVPLSPQSRGS